MFLNRITAVSTAAFILLSVTACKTTRGNKPVESPMIEAVPSAEQYKGLSEVPAEGEPVDGDWIIRNLADNPPTLNPILSSDTTSGAVLSFLFESLVTRDLETMEIKPALAESWTVSDDKKTYTFKIRKGVKFHDGTEMTIEDVVYSYERLLDPEIDAPEKRSYFSQVEYVKQTGPDTFECRFKDIYFLALEVCGEVEIMPKHVYSTVKGKEWNTQPANEKPIGTGPMKFVEWKRGETITLERFSGYWGPADEKLHIDRMIFRFIKDPEAEFISYTKGDLDAVSIRPEKWFKEAATPEFMEKNWRLEYDYPAYSYIGWNMRRPQFSDAKTRIALQLLMNRDLIATQIYRGLARPIESTEFDKSPYWNPDLAPRKYDPEKAIVLLKEAGWADTDRDGILDRNGTPFEFTLNITQGSPEAEQSAVTFQDALKRAGIKLSIAILDWANQLQKIDKRDFDSVMMGWALSVDPDYYQIWHSSQADIEGGNNYSGLKNARLDELIGQNRRELDKNKRVSIVREMQKIIYDEAPYLFFLSRKATIAASKRYRNIRFYTPRPCVDYREWYVPKALQKYATP